MVIYFSKCPARYNAQNMTVVFPALVDGAEVMCEISAEALEDNFEAQSARGEDLLAAFEAHRDEIESVAKSMLPQRLPAGRCLLVSADF